MKDIHLQIVLNIQQHQQAYLEEQYHESSHLHPELEVEVLLKEVLILQHVLMH